MISPAERGLSIFDSMKRVVVGIFAGLAAIFVGLGFVMPSLAKLRQYEALSTAGLLLTGVLLVLAGVAAIAYSFSGPRRRAILTGNAHNRASQ